MPGQGNDRLERFFRKAANRPQLTFSEEDWSKLEARLDAADAAKLASVKSPKKIITASAVALILLSTVGIWWGTSDGLKTDLSGPGVALSPPSSIAPTESTTEMQKDAKNDAGETGVPPRESAATKNIPEPIRTEPSADLGKETRLQENTEPLDPRSSPPPQEAALKGSVVMREVSERNRAGNVNEEGNDWKPLAGGSQKRMLASDTPEGSGLIRPLAGAQVKTELSALSSAIAGGYAALAERNKQKARIELPGAEEADTIGRQTMVEEEHASGKTEHVARPRLSLLLSFAPDFSGTSLGRYSAPGKAFGAMIHYHAGKRWSVAVGAIKNNKTYTGDGEDYTPPKGYWKYYTNGVIPESIDGSCSVLEFPVMLQYTVVERGRNKWILGAGTSSYLMQSESYRYHFDQPNPGAKEGWDSKGSSRFLFNMLNVSLAYEHQVMPGLMVGIEPYIKLPLEEIGWSSLKLYSSGASVTLRYTLIGRKQIVPDAFRSRGPD